MMSIEDLPTPSLLLDLNVLERNLDRAAARATDLGVALRPHIKTHKCIEVGQMQASRNISGITVSTLYEGEVFADHGFNDITWAFPFIPNRLAQAQRLADRITLRLTVDSQEAVDLLDRSGYPFHVLLKIDCGYHRAGVDPDSTDAVELARRIANAKTLKLDGILSHSGHSYDATSQVVAQTVAEIERLVMSDLAGRLEDAGLHPDIVSIGSTPAFMAATNLDGVTEARPGNYAFFDYTQTTIGSCKVENVAVSVLATVVSSQSHNRHSIIDAGALAMSKDRGPSSHEGHYGRVFEDYGSKRLNPDLRLVGLSQEHGKLNDALPVGTRLRVLPNHSCLTVAQFDELFAIREGAIVDKWKIWRGRN